MYNRERLNLAHHDGEGSEETPKYPTASKVEHGQYRVVGTAASEKREITQTIGRPRVACLRDGGIRTLRADVSRWDRTQAVDCHAVCKGALQHHINLVVLASRQTAVDTQPVRKLKSPGSRLTDDATSL